MVEMQSTEACGTAGDWPKLGENRARCPGQQRLPCSHVCCLARGSFWKRNCRWRQVNCPSFSSFQGGWLRNAHFADDKTEIMMN